VVERGLEHTRPWVQSPAPRKKKKTVTFYSYILTYSQTKVYDVWDLHQNNLGEEEVARSE
jgi:hypothetical protein